MFCILAYLAWRHFFRVLLGSPIRSERHSDDAYVPEDFDGGTTLHFEATGEATAWPVFNNDDVIHLTLSGNGSR